ncbi:MAG TPA: alpha/beta hydrolase [Chloroflexota bacterium]|nr:alpha/beta hydrolase [Chloroflexota bacterium]
MTSTAGQRAAEALGWMSGEVQANGIRQHYWRTGEGSGKPGLVLAHGATDNGLCWTRVAKALEGEWDIVMPDARGHGRSESPEEDYSAGARAADLAALIRELGLERPVVGGHSMGAATTLRLAAERPELVRAAILEDPGLRMGERTGGDWGRREQEEAEARRERMRRNAEEAKALGRDGLMARQRERTPHWHEDEVGPWADAKLQVSERFSLARRGQERPDWPELLPRVQCPTLLITADPERGGIVTPEAVEEARRLLPSLVARRVDGAGHSIHRDKFEEVLGVVKEFLAGV